MSITSRLKLHCWGFHVALGCLSCKTGRREMENRVTLRNKTRLLSLTQSSPERVKSCPGVLTKRQDKMTLKTSVVAASRNSNDSKPHGRKLCERQLVRGANSNMVEIRMEFLHFSSAQSFRPISNHCWTGFHHRSKL